MNFSIVLKFIFLFLASSPACNADSISSIINCLLFNCNKGSPINFYTSDAQPVQGPSKIQISVSTTAQCQFVNKDRTLVITIVNPSAEDSLTIQSFSNEEYWYYRTDIFWAGDQNQDASNTIDNKGCPFQIRSIYVKKTYNSIDEASKNCNGLVIIYTCVPVSSNIIDYNYLFNLFLGQLAYVAQNPGKPITVPCQTLFAWSEKNTYVEYPFMYQGDLSNPNEKEFQQYQKPQIIVHTPPGYQPIIYFAQFNGFKVVKDENGQYYYRTLKPVPMGCRSVQKLQSYQIQLN